MGKYERGVFGSFQGCVGTVVGSTWAFNNAKAIFDKVAQVRGADPKANKADSVLNTLHIAMLDSVSGKKGEMNKGVYEYTIGRPDAMLKEHGIAISTFMGFNKIFFLHYWGVGPADQLAKGLRAALDQTGKTMAH